MTTLTQAYPRGIPGGRTDRGVGEVAEGITRMWQELFYGQREPISQGPGIRDAFGALAAVRAECLEQDWDGYGAVPVDLLAAEKAEVFLRALPAWVPAPEVAADPDGEVSLDWHRDPCDILSISISRDGRLSWASVISIESYHATEFFVDEIPRRVMEQLDQLLSSDFVEGERR